MEINKAKVLLVLPDDKLGGAEQYLFLVTNYFLKKGSSIEIFFLKRKTSNNWDNIENNHLKIDFLNSSTNSFGLLLLFFRILFKKSSYDFVFSSHFFITSFLGLLVRLKVLHKNHFVGRESTTTFSRFKGFKLTKAKLLYKIGYANLDLLICQTSDMKNQLCSQVPSISKKIKIEVVSNPIDIELIQTKGKEKINTKVYGDYIVSAGRLISLKGFDILINAFYKFKDYNLNLVILGEGEERKNLEKLIKNKNLENKVFLIGHVENVYPYFFDARMCVVSSLIEGFPNVLLQMMSQNRNVVSTDCAHGISDMPGIYSCSVNDVTQLEKSMGICLKENKPENRDIFDEYLKGRDIGEFMEKIWENLELKIS